jgi:hypothetical protein
MNRHQREQSTAIVLTTITMIAIYLTSQGRYPLGPLDIKPVAAGPSNGVQKKSLLRRLNPFAPRSNHNDPQARQVQGPGS